MNARPPRLPSLPARLLEPLVSSLWILFLVWSALVAVVWGASLGEVEIARLTANPGLRAALVGLVQTLDPIWMILAALNAYSATVSRQGLPVARRWALGIFLGATAIAWMSARHGFPLGPILYTSRLGMRLGPVPLGLPLFWIAVIFGARDAALRFLPKAGHLLICAATGLLALLTALNLEPLAWTRRSWWLWQSAAPSVTAGPPLWNFATGFVAAALAAFFMREAATPSAKRPAGSAAAVVAVLNAVFLLCHLWKG